MIPLLIACALVALVKMAQYITREGTLTTVNQTIAISGLLGTTTTVTVPAGVSKIVQIIPNVGANATAAGVLNAFLRLTGPGLAVGGDYDIGVGSFIVTGTPADGDTIGLGTSQPINVDIPVTPGNVLNMEGGMHGVDVGDTEMQITLVFA